MSARVVAHSGHEAARHLDPQSFDHFPAQRAQCHRIDEQHPLIVQPDAPVAHGETQPRN